MRMVLVGPPGCGKGTQASQLCEKYGIAHVATGDLFREHVAANDELGRSAKEYMDKGALVPDTIVMAMVEHRLAQADCASGFLLDGFPRTVPQAEALQAILSGRSLWLDAVVDLEVPDEDIVNRLGGRRVCLHCGEPYHIVSRCPKVEGKCDKCGTELIHRSDDEPGTIRNRLGAYHEQTEPLIEFFGQLGLVKKINGAQTPDQVFGEIDSSLGPA